MTHLPKGFHRIRHYGLLANRNRAANIAKARELLAVPAPAREPETREPASSDEPAALVQPCPCCGGRIIIIETFEAGSEPKIEPSPCPLPDVNRSKFSSGHTKPGPRFKEDI